MITIRHNFDKSHFKWLWSRYVTSGRLEYHCVQSIPGKYSRKFSGVSNPLFNEQKTIAMDEVADGQYEAIYFCGVIKKGYCNKNPLKNNYVHNVHFAVIPKEGSHDIWEFENWHVEIENGVLERIPLTYELNECFFKEPYTSHYYTCRIFRWMVGHFYPELLCDVLHGRPEVIYVNGTSHNMREIIKAIIEEGKIYAKSQVESSLTTYRNHLFRGDFSRSHFYNNLPLIVQINELKNTHLLNCIESITSTSTDYTPEVLNNYFRIGIEEYLETISTYQDRLYFSL